MQGLRIALLFFPIFCAKLDNHKNEKMMELNISKKVSCQVRRSQKIKKNCQAIMFLGFLQKSSPFICTFSLLEYESTNGLLTFSKNQAFGENLVLELSSRNL